MSDISDKLTASKAGQEDRGAGHPSSGRKRSRRRSGIDEDSLMRRLYPYTVFEYCYRMSLQDGDSNGKK
ncbi:hypothetical protein SG0102_02140 [Intestinibaculum porci]|uniref:Uncharacterized protein n=1 Tax=Intestinibaculum porci TaxID=2487118 RepID=A0A3G9J277_9FIRM|nr:hypothetical protein [Intestinibaculum porci]BBH25280.1 hypothetical protein SG0102_02140 [Intestinibaculum porci]